jgi:hypothetical protein
MSKYYEYTINVTVKTNNGSFGIKYDYQGEFNFCAQSPHDARAIAGHHVKDAVSNVDSTRLVEILSYTPVKREVFPLRHAELKSCREVQSETEEATA